MSLSCPNCNTDLPEHGELEYSFCPRCGAEITVTGADSVDDFLTIPPNLNHAAAQGREQMPEPERIQRPRAVSPAQTLEPVIADDDTPRPQIVPPPGPPPTSFYRAGSPQNTSGSEIIQESPVLAPRKPTRRVIIVLGAIVIWMGLMLYLLLV
jgi:hypothetical protein